MRAHLPEGGRITVAGAAVDVRTDADVTERYRGFRVGAVAEHHRQRAWWSRRKAVLSS